MKLALIFFSVLTSLSFSFGMQKTSPPKLCRGKSLPIQLLPGPKMTWQLTLPLVFGGRRDFPRPPIMAFRSDKPFQLAVRTREEFSEFWKHFTSGIPPENGIPPLPEVDFTKEMLLISVMGQRPSSGYWTIIEGACEVDGQLDVYIGSVEDVHCSGQFPTLTYPADAVRIPRSDLPVVFHETEIPCREWKNRVKVEP